MIFRLARPTTTEVERIRDAQRAAVLSYTSLHGFTIDRYSVRLGEGIAVFQRAARALREWKMIDLGWLRAFPSGVEVGLSPALRLLVG